MMFQRKIIATLGFLGAFGVAFIVMNVSEAASVDESEAEKLMIALEGSLFGEAEASEVDEALMEAIHHDLDSIEFGDDVKGRESVDSIFGANPLTGDGNPLLLGDHRKRWLATAIASVGSEKVTKHLKKQAKELKTGDVSRSDWYDHVAKCTAICNPVVQGLLYEHVRQVASRPHMLLAFPSGSAEASAGELVKLARFTDAAAAEGARFLLIGRGSRTGNREFNRTLSARRVESVEADLLKLGVATDAVSGFWLGYEPPQINDDLARVYRLAANLGDLARNQSVMVVAYK